MAMGRISSFPIDLRRRPYNTLALPCECVITEVGQDAQHLLKKSVPACYKCCCISGLVQPGILLWYLLTNMAVVTERGREGGLSRRVTKRHQPESVHSSSNLTVINCRTDSGCSRSTYQPLSCCVVNACSLKKPNALQLLTTEICSHEVDVAAVTETDRKSVV